ncbi:MAG TPA: HD-GYP domain-containing protein, partial [Acidimicrobiia bacterium]|nr:HD-GYP domain-containing protein [Acidimicrobiia bacterium]
VSLAYDGFLQTLEGRGIESLTFVPPLDPADMARLVTLLGDGAGWPAEGGSIRLNQAPWTREQLRDGEMAASRGAYASSIHVLRSMGTALGHGTAVDLSGAATAVGSLLDLCVGEPASALLLSTMKSHSEYTFYHSVNTCILALAMGRLLGLGDADLVLLGMGAMLHDIGKLGIAPALLHHPGRLTPEQRREMERHPLVGAEAILTASHPGQEVVATVALEHHARYDGAGYPPLAHFRRPPAGEAAAGTHPLHLFTRLVAVADAYDALTSRRAYRRAETPGYALQILLDGSGSWWDPDSVLAFVQLMGTYPPGSLLRLRDGRVVVVTGSAEQPGACPPALLVVDAAGHRPADPEPVTFDHEAVDDLLTAEQVDAPPAAVLAGGGAVPSPSA